jgi:hypothetical protein
LRVCGRTLETAVGPVEPKRTDELFARLVEVLGDDVQHVRVAAAGHADVHAGSVQSLGQLGVSGRGRDALGSVGGGRVAEVDVLADVRAGQGDGPPVLLRAVALDGPNGAVVADALDGPGLPVRDPQRVVVLPCGDHVASADG